MTLRPSSIDRLYFAMTDAFQRSEAPIGVPVVLQYFPVIRGKSMTLTNVVAVTAIRDDLRGQVP